MCLRLCRNGGACELEYSWCKNGHFSSQKWTVTRMQTIRKNLLFKFAVAFMLVLFLLLSFLFQIGRAGTRHQTIPTAPPTTAIIPTISSTETPTSPPQITVISTQPTRVIPSQTTTSTVSPTVQTIISSPSIVSTATGLPGNGTIPGLTATQSSTQVALISPTSSSLPTTPVSSALKIPGYRGVLYCLLGGGIVLIFIIAIVLFLRSRKK